MIRFIVELDEADLEALKRFTRARAIGVVAKILTEQPIDVALAKVVCAAENNWTIASDHPSLHGATTNAVTRVEDEHFDPMREPRG